MRFIARWRSIAGRLSVVAWWCSVARRLSVVAWWCSVAGLLSVVAWWCSVAGRLSVVAWWSSIAGRLRVVALRRCSVTGLLVGSCVCVASRNRAIIWLLGLVRCWLLRVSWLLRVRWRRLFRIHRCLGGRLLRVGWWCFSVGRLSRGCIGFIRWWCVWWRSWMTVRVGRWRTIW